MKTKRNTLIVAGAILALLSSQVLAQPWGAGAGRGQRAGRGQGLEPGLMQAGPGSWCPLGLGPLAMDGQLARRLGLTADQAQKIRGILDKARSEVLASIKDVLTQEQVKQLKQMRDRAGQRGGQGRGPALQDEQSGPMGRRFQRGMGQDAQVGPRRQGSAEQPFAGRRGAGQGQQFQRGASRPDVAPLPPIEGQNANRGQLQSRGAPALERIFDLADTDQNGALTKEEIRAFREKTQQNQ